MWSLTDIWICVFNSNEKLKIVFWNDINTQMNAIALLGKIAKTDN